MVYPATRDEEAFEPVLDGLRQASKRIGSLSPSPA
jgi:hypothetical protein